MLLLAFLLQRINKNCCLKVSSSFSTNFCLQARKNENKDDHGIKNSSHVVTTICIIILFTANVLEHSFIILLQGNNTNQSNRQSLVYFVLNFQDARNKFYLKTSFFRNIFGYQMVLFSAFIKGNLVHHIHIVCFSNQYIVLIGRFKF